MMDFVTAAQYIAKKGLVTASSGNLSQRQKNGIVHVSASGSWFEFFTQDEIICVALDHQVASDGDALWGVVGKKPTSELELHLKILKYRPDVNVILHFQSPYATVLSASELISGNLNVIPEIPYYMGSIARVPYYTPGSTELAGVVSQACKEHDVVLMQSHGQIAVGPDFEDVISKALFLELACMVRVLGKAVISLDEERVKALIDYRKKRTS